MSVVTKFTVVRGTLVCPSEVVGGPTLHDYWESTPSVNGVELDPEYYITSDNLAPVGLMKNIVAFVRYKWTVKQWQWAVVSKAGPSNASGLTSDFTDAIHSASFFSRKARSNE